ncbi:hypothetical protein ACB098_04G103500 [Castanea mollissima]
MTSSPTPIHLVTSPSRSTWESDGGGAGCGSEAVESDGEDDNDEDDENGFGGGDDEDGEDDDDEDDGGENGCCSEMGRFSWLIGGKMEQSSLVGESLITTMDHSFNWIFFKDGICSHSFGSSRTKTRSSSTIFFFFFSIFSILCLPTIKEVVEYESAFSNVKHKFIHYVCHITGVTFNSNYWTRLNFIAVF